MLHQSERWLLGVQALQKDNVCSVKMVSKFRLSLCKEESEYFRKYRININKLKMFYLQIYVNI